MSYELMILDAPSPNRKHFTYVSSNVCRDD